MLKLKLRKKKKRVMGVNQAGSRMKNPVPPIL